MEVFVNSTDASLSETATFLLVSTSSFFKTTISISLSKVFFFGSSALSFKTSVIIGISLISESLTTFFFFFFTIPSVDFFTFFTTFFTLISASPLVSEGAEASTGISPDLCVGDRRKALESDSVFWEAEL